MHVERPYFRSITCERGALPPFKSTAISDIRVFLAFQNTGLNVETIDYVRPPGVPDSQPPLRGLSEIEEFFENGAVALHLVGADGTILRANKAELDLLGYEGGEFVGRNIIEFHADHPVIEDL